MTFPSGNFTIVNNATGRAVRVRLGESVDVSDHKEGMKYLLSVTEPPRLELGPADGTPATVWRYHTAHDDLERQPFNQVVSHAVGEYQSIGDYCVWLDTEAGLATTGLTEPEVARREELLKKLEAAPQEVRAKLDALVPSLWATIPSHKVMTADGRRTAWYKLVTEFMFLDELEQASSSNPFTSQLLDCADVIREAQIEVPRAPEGEKGPDILIGSRAYGCGAERRSGRTCRWVYDGTHIYAADSQKIVAENTYWTDYNGHLVGTAKGAAKAQEWTVKPWTLPEPDRNKTAIVLTGLLGPFGAIFGG